jgi:hypothetical protein
VTLRVGVAGAALLATAVAVPPQRPTPTRTEVSRGIFLYQTPPYGDVGLDGNSIVITSTDGVLVFDSNGTPAAAAAVLADIRTLTDQPVRYVVNSLWLEQKRGVDAVMPELHDLMVRITHDDPAVNDAFRVQLVDWYMHRVYDELSGPLTDAIAPIPAQ